MSEQLHNPEELAAAQKFESRIRYNEILQVPVGQERYQKLVAFVNDPTTHEFHREQARTIAHVERQHYAHLIEDNHVPTLNDELLILPEISDEEQV